MSFTCVHGIVLHVEGYAVGSAWCVVHFVVHGECIMLWLAAASVQLSMADIVHPVCRDCEVMSSIWRFCEIYCC